MSRRLRRWTHKFMGAAGYQRFAGDVEVQGNLIGPSMALVSTAIDVLACNTTTPVKLATPTAEGLFRAILLRWTKQYNLRNFDHYEIQVSDDDATWYSLKFDGTDWKDVLNADTDWPREMCIHTDIPLTGAADDPAGRLLYYRVRQVTVLGVISAWSDSVSATTLTVAAGDLAANTIYANNIIAAEINTLLLRATAEVIVGQDYSGSPALGNQRVVIDDNELTLQEYDGSAWVGITQFGGDDILKWYVQCRGIVKAGALTELAALAIGDKIPNASCRIWDFEDNYEDQSAIDPWDVKTNLAFSTSMKFGAKSLTHTASKVGHLVENGALGITTPNDFGFSGYHYKPAVTNERMFLGINKGDAVTWTSRTSASAQQWYSVCWSPELGLFCAVSYDGAVGVQVMTSPDGITWTSRTSASAQAWRSVCWSPELGLFCAVSYDGAVGVQVMTSPDGITWTSRTSASAQAWYSVCWSPELGLLCAVAASGGTGVQIMTSPDGITWTSRTSPSVQAWYSVCWSPELGLLCAVASDGAVGVQIMTSPDGITWTSRTSASAQAWHSVCWSPELGLFCAVASDGAVGVQVMTSPDGITWTSRTSASAQVWRSVCWSPELGNFYIGLFCAVASGGATGVQIMTSPDGITWTSRTSASAQTWRSVCWSPKTGFCAVAANGAVGVQVMTTSYSGMRLYETSTGYKLIVGTAVEQTRVAASSQWHHVGITVRTVTGQPKWGLAVDAWSTEVNIAAHPIEAASWLHFYLRDGARIDDWCSLISDDDLSLTEMVAHAATGQPWVGTDGVDYLLDLILLTKTGGKIKLLSPTDYYAPVADEPSAGTPHRLPRDNASYAILGDAGHKAAWTLYTLPVGLQRSGAKSIKVRAYMDLTASVVPSYVFWYFCDVNTQTIASAVLSKNIGVCSISGPVANITNWGSAEFDIPITAAGEFYYCDERGGTITAQTLQLVMLGYDC